MEERRQTPPESPTAIGMQTGMDVPGLEDVRGPLEEGLMVPRVEGIEGLDIVPGQSGSEGTAAVPQTGPGPA